MNACHIDPLWTLYHGDALAVLKELPDESVHCCVTSPPYWGLRDYGVAGQLGLEKTPDEYVAKIVEVFREVRRVLRDDGTLWLNLGSSYWGGGGFCPTAPSTAFSKSGKYGSKGRLIKGRAFYDGKQPNQSQGGAPACGIDGKGLLDSRVSGRVCPDCRGELTACSPNRPHHIARNGQPHAQSLPQPSPIGHGSEPSDCASTSLDTSVLGAGHSTKPSSPENVAADYGLAAMASACQPEQVTSSPDDSLSSHNSVCTSGIAENDRPSFFRNSDIPFVCMACGYSTRMSPPYKAKDLVNIPFLVSEALRADGWYLRSDIIWHKPNPMPESVTDRPTKAHEYIFLLSKSERYHYDADAIKEPAIRNGEFNNSQETHSEYSMHRVFQVGEYRNKRSVWTVATSPYPEAHFATYPPDLIKPCIMAGCPLEGIVLDPFAGSGTTGQVALELGRKAVLIELNAAYLPLIQSRLATTTPGLKLG